ncbi:hypothetical protein RB195_010103 [Necator americanus]|uniref:Uncharacterized protein n=1 Tax=Necator americanus TaxID=51031 RepID=A0ABR1CWE9_NECAM
MSAFLSSQDPSSPNMVVLFTRSECCSMLFLAALEWAESRCRKTYYIRRNRFERYTYLLRYLDGPSSLDVRAPASLPLASFSRHCHLLASLVIHSSVLLVHLSSILLIM